MDGARYALLAFIACGAPHPADDAIRYERGDGVRRDYTRAAQIYAERCAAGSGDPVACRKLVLASTKHRGDLAGVKTLDVGMLKLLATACRAGDWLSCIPQVGLDTDRARMACDAGAAAACLALADDHLGPNLNGDDHAEIAYRTRACSLDLLEACIEIVARPGVDIARVPPDVKRRVDDACRKGDADACAALGRPIAASELCQAHDFAACIATGKAADLETACGHDVKEACGKVALTALDADPPDPHVVEKFARACRSGGAIVGRINVCTMNRPADLLIGCAAYEPERIPPDRRMILPSVPGMPGRPFLFVRTSGISSDVLREVAQRLAPDIGVYTQDLSGPPAPPATAVTLDPKLAAAPISTLTSPDPRALPFGQAGLVVVDSTGRPRAMLSAEFGLVPATFARCLTGLLAEP